MERNTKIGLVGAGYIADWHAAAIDRCPGVEVATICDRSAAAIDRFASGRPGIETYSDLGQMLTESDCRSVHVLTPPDNHVVTTTAVLESGRDAFVEKPLALSEDACLSLAEAARRHDVRVGVNHNFLWLPSYERLFAGVSDGTIGPPNNIVIDWQLSLPVLRSGPYGLWLNTSQENLLHEILPHGLAFAFDLTDTPEIRHVEPLNPTILPTGAGLHQGLTVIARAGQTSIVLIVSFVEGMPAMRVRVRGPGGLATADYGRDVFVLEQSNAGDIVVGPLVHELRTGLRHIGAGFVNAWRQTRSANALAPFGLSMVRSIEGFYTAPGGATDRRHGVERAAQISGAIAEIGRMVASASPVAGSAPRRAPVKRRKAGQERPTILVFGGTGYIGRYLVRRLAADGYKVQVFSRGTGDPFPDLGDRVRMISGNLHSQEDLLDTMAGVDTVFNLARANEKSWNDYRERDVAVTRLIGECAIEAGIRRLVYTGTIDSYDASGAVPVIDETTPFGDLTRRNPYARAKAAGEDVLLGLHQERGLPLVIARPGIVIGGDGPLTHWGVALWRDATTCTLWGDGRNPLPFVTIEDCVDGLARMATAQGIEGQSFNLVGDPILSARDYLDAVSNRAGVRIRYRQKPIWSYYLTDITKYAAKRALGKRTGPVPSYRDWASRSQKARFANDRARQLLGWAPVGDRAKLLDDVIDPVRLFGQVRA